MEPVMKKMLVLFILSVLSGTILASGIPLGLEKGMSLEQVAAILGRAPVPYALAGDEVKGYLYRVDSWVAPPEFGLFLLRITPRAGLSEIFLHTRPMSQGRVSQKANYVRLLEMLTSHYGLPVTTPVFPVGGRVIPGELESMTSSWKPQGDGLEQVILYWRLHPSQNIMHIYYRFDNWREAGAEAASPQDTP